MSGIVKPRIGAYRRHLLVCTGPRCTADGQAQALFDSLGSKFKAAGLDAGDLRVKRTRAACFAACRGGPRRWASSGRRCLRRWGRGWRLSRHATRW